MPGGVLCCPASTGKHRLTTAGCAEYVLKFGMEGHAPAGFARLSLELSLPFNLRVCVVP